MQKKTPIERLHKTRKTFFKIIILSGIMSVFIFFVINSPLFYIKKININKNKNLNKEDLLKQSTIIKNTNIFKFKIIDAKASLEKNPFIKSVNIKRKLPSTVDIEIIERKKAFLFQYISVYLLVDTEGFIMDHLDKKDNKLPVVTGFNIDSTEVGHNIFKKEENKKLKDFIDEAHNLHLLNKLSEVDKDFANDINIKLKDGIFIAFGTLNNVEYKLNLLKEILDDINKKEIKTDRIIMNKGKHPILIIDD